jgi:hypothetical protein
LPEKSGKKSKSAASPRDNQLDMWAYHPEVQRKTEPQAQPTAAPNPPKQSQPKQNPGPHLQPKQARVEPEPSKTDTLDRAPPVLAQAVQDSTAATVYLDERSPNECTDPTHPRVHLVNEFIAGTGFGFYCEPLRKTACAQCKKVELVDVVKGHYRIIR